MNKIDSTWYIQVDKEQDGDFTPTEIEDDLDKYLQRYEYGDIQEGLFEIWEYPSGKMFAIVPDREVQENNYYAGPREDLWLPKLVLKGIDEKKVHEAFVYLKNRKR